MRLRRIAPLLLAGALALVPAVSRAQSTGGLRGTVIDKDSQPIAGVTVVVNNAALGVSNRGAVTDAKGEWRVAPLPPGKGYTITVSMQTFSTTTLSDIEVTTGHIVAVPITLRPSAENTQTIRVVGTQDVVNQADTTTTTTINSEFIDALPILGRNYQDVLTLAPGVTDVNGDGNPNIHGSRDTDVVTLVDGVSTVDPVTGQVGQQLNINSIQDIEVVTSGASAEFGRAQGGFVRVTTKSGGNDFEGSFRFDWRGKTLDNDGAGIDNSRYHGGLGENGLRDLKFNDVYPVLTLSGPIRKDKAWYFVTAEYRQEQTPVNALTQAFVRTHKERRIFGKASWDISTNHKLVFTGTFDPQQDFNLGLDSFTPVQSGYMSTGGGRNLVLRETAVFSPNVFLDTTLQDYIEKPTESPTTGADTNGNGLQFIDRNHNGFFDATELDPGEDFDQDGKFDIFEDTNRNGRLDNPGEDILFGDNDGRLTTPGPHGGCEGVHREDVDCDGRLDTFDEDPNGNGICDPSDPLYPNCDNDHDGVLERGTEDRNGDGSLNDRVTPLATDRIPDGHGGFTALYPYGELVPLPADLPFQQDQRTGRTSGPFNSDFTGNRGRQTFKQDLTMFVPDWHGQHEMKAGVVVEREHYSQTTDLRPFYLPNAGPPQSAAFEPKIGVILPAEGTVGNSATSMTGAMYIQDTYKPLPNLTVNLGLRFEREATDSFGYTPFDPVQERNLFDRLNDLGGGERGHPDDVVGNNDGISQQGYCGDPMLILPGNSDPCTNPSNPPPILNNLNGQLHRLAISRLTEHHTSTTLVANDLQALFPEAVRVVTDPLTGVTETIVDREILRQQGATFQEEQPFRLTNNNLAPRLAISWDPWSDSKTKVFGTWSRFYDKLFLNAIVPEEGPDTITRYYKKDADGLTASGIPDNTIGAAISKAPPSASQVDRGLQTPFSDEMTMGFERELAPEVSLRISYIKKRGRLGLQDRDINHVTRCCDPKTGGLLDVNGRLDVPSQQSGGAAVIAGDNVPDLYVENFFFNQIFRTGNFNTSMYNGIEVQVTKRLSRKWQMDASYTYSRAKGFAESFNSSLGDDPATLPYEYGYLSFDQRHLLRLNGTTFLPGDWTVGGVFAWASGLPYSVITTRFDLDSFQYGQFRTLYGRIVQTNSGLNPFTPEFRNDRRNDSTLQIDLQAAKSFVIGRFNSKFFFAVQNLLNTDFLTITDYQPDNPNRSGNLQLNASRAFGRRYQLGFQFEF